MAQKTREMALPYAIQESGAFVQFPIFCCKGKCHSYYLFKKVKKILKKSYNISKIAYHQVEVL